MLRDIDWKTFEGQPDHLTRLANFYEHGADPGQFLSDILMNDLQGTMLRLEGESWLPKINYICRWLYAYMPALAYGDCYRYRTWRAKGGRQGRLKEQLSAPVARRVVGDEKAEQPVNE